jgi:alcohol dehydrogenase class IV
VIQEFQAPHKIITGDGSATALGAQAQALGVTRVVLVTDKVLHEKTDSVSDAVACLKASGVAVEVFDDVEPDPLVNTARRSAEFARRVAPNGIVGLEAEARWTSPRPQRRSWRTRRRWSRCGAWATFRSRPSR